MVKTRAETKFKKKRASAMQHEKKKLPVKKYLAVKLQSNEKRIKRFLTRRPHRSFMRTRRRDYARSLDLPGYIAFTHSVFITLRKQGKTFLLLILVSAIATGLLAGIASQGSFTLLYSALNGAGKNVLDGSGWSQLGKAGILFYTTITGGISSQSTEVQQVFGVLVGSLVWLSTVWLLRAGMSGNKPRLRDALYNSGSPIVSTIFLLMLFFIQLIPLAAVVIGYSTAQTTDLFSTGFLAMLFSIIALLLTILSLYLITSTFFALVIITLPGMYPWKALRASGDLVIGRRLRILSRILWMSIYIVVIWTVVFIPAIAFFSWLQGSVSQIAGVPFIPVLLTLMISATTVFSSAYIYILYRKVVDDDASPA